MTDQMPPTPPSYPHAPTHGFSEPVADWYPDSTDEALHLLHWQLPIPVDLEAVLGDTYRSCRALRGAPERAIVHMLPGGDGSAREAIVEVTEGSVSRAEAVVVYAERLQSDPTPSVPLEEYIGRLVSTWVGYVMSGVGLTCEIVSPADPFRFNVGRATTSDRVSKTVSTDEVMEFGDGPVRYDGAVSRGRDGVMLQFTPVDGTQRNTYRMPARGVARRYSLCHELDEKYRAEEGPSPE